jgi:hypothetical protein
MAGSALISSKLTVYVNALPDDVNAVTGLVVTRKSTPKSSKALGRGCRHNQTTDKRYHACEMDLLESGQDAPRQP